MKRTLLRLLFSSIIFTLLASCGTPASGPTQAPAASETQAPVATTPPPAVVVDGSAALPALPAEKIISFGSIVPIGVASDTGDGIGITFYGTDGLVLGEVRAPSLAFPSPATIHVAGSYTGALDFPVIHLSFTDNQSSLQISQNDQVTTQVDVLQMFGLTGVPGQPIVAYSILQPQADGVMRSEVYLGDLASFPFASAVLAYDSAESLSVIPVMIRTQDGAASGLWYTLRPYGIGGEIVFDPNKGLYYLDLRAHEVYEALPRDVNFSALAQDQLWTAQSTQAGLTLRNLSTGQSVDLPKLAESERGAGAAVFSTSNMLAWLEVRGSLADGTFFTTVRVANEDGILLPEYPQSVFYKAAGLGDQVSVKPVGWLDEQNLLVQVSTLGKDRTSAIVRLNIGSGEINLLAPGTFVGFLNHP